MTNHTTTANDRRTRTRRPRALSHVRRTLIGLAIASLVLSACGGLFRSAEEKALIAETEERHQEAIEIFESIDWPEGYERTEPIDIVAAYAFEETYGGGNTGRYGSYFLWPEGTSGSDWFRAFDAAIMASGEFEGWEKNMDVIGLCDDDFAHRTYRQTSSGNDIVVIYSTGTPDPEMLLKAVYSYNPRDIPTLPPVERMTPRPGDPCDYPDE